VQAQPSASTESAYSIKPGVSITLSVACKVAAA
jgi:hypothetical protein